MPSAREPTSLRRRPLAADAAVSPVIGMILVLLVSVVGIAATLYWGLPAIDEMKANVEVRSLRSQFTEFLSDLNELAAGTAGKTAKHWQPSLQRGTLSVVENSEKWIIGMDMRGATAGKYDFYWSALGGAAPSETDNVIKIHNKGTSFGGASGDLLRAYLMSGASEEQIVILEDAAGACSTTSMSQVTSWTAGTTKEFRLCRNNAGTAEVVNLDVKTVRIEIVDDNKVVAAAWYFDAGKLEFNLDAGVGNKQLIVSNGALIEGTNGKYVFLTSPPIPPPKTSSTSHRWFGRVVELNGAASFGGQDRFDMILNLQGTGQLKDVECDRAVVTSCVEAVKMYPLGTLKDVWVSFYSSTSNGYSFTSTTNTAEAGASFGDEKLVVDRSTAGMGFTLIRSAITATG